MGKVEEGVRKRARKQNIQHAVLGSIKVVGILAMAAVAPNTLRLLKYIDGPRSLYVARVSATRRRLESKGLIRVVGSGPRRGVALTKRGEQLLLRLELGSAKYKSPKKWDGKWRIVMFDITERRRLARDRLRHLLIKIGFIKLQDSVWIFPHDCEDIISMIKADFSVGREVLYIVTDEVEGDRWLKGLFKLPSRTE